MRRRADNYPEAVQAVLEAIAQGGVDAGAAALTPIAYRPRDLPPRPTTRLRDIMYVFRRDRFCCRLRLGLIPWTTPVHLFPRHGFHIYDDDAVIAATETATATLTGAADIAAYRELFAALQASATFDDEARAHLERIGDAYRTLS